MSITATVENDTIKLPAGMHVPNGTRVDILLPNASTASQEDETFYERMKEFIGCIKDGPEDLAAEHDHYVHGAPKRSAQ